jgi:hypothetical protein
MAELQLSIEGSSTVPANNLVALNGALESLTEAHQSGDPIAVRSGALRWRDGSVWVSVTLTMPTTPRDLSADEDALARVAVDAGIFDFASVAKEEIDVSGA